MRRFHASAAPESAALAAAGVGVAVSALAARYALGVYQRVRGSGAPPPSDGDAGAPVGTRVGAAPGGASAGAGAAGDASTAGGAAGAGAGAAPTGGGFFGAQSMARRFYRGGFEDKMTRREAALILGVRCVGAAAACGCAPAAPLMCGRRVQRWGRSQPTRPWTPPR